MCGNMNYGWQGPPIFTQNTGPVRATYLSGQNVTMNILVS